MGDDRAWWFNAKLDWWWRDVAERLAQEESIGYSEWLRRRLMEHALALAYAERDLSVFGDGKGVDLDLVRDVLHEGVWVVLAGASYGADLSRVHEERVDFVLDLMRVFVGTVEPDELRKVAEMVEDDRLFAGRRGGR